jgi:hemerythrin-like domain-containing protein
MSKPIEAGDGLAQLREILVGTIQRDLERRLTRVEAHGAVRTTEAQQEAKQRIEFIEAHLRAEVESLGHRLRTEGTETKEAIRALSREHRETAAALEQRVGKLEEALTRMQQDLRDQILAQAKVFLDELHRVRSELLETMDRELNAFEHDLVEEGSHRGEHEQASATP